MTRREAQRGAADVGGPPLEGEAADRERPRSRVAGAAPCAAPARGVASYTGGVRPPAPAALLLLAAASLLACWLLASGAPPDGPAPPSHRPPRSPPRLEASAEQHGADRGAGPATGQVVVAGRVEADGRGTAAWVQVLLLERAVNGRLPPGSWAYRDDVPPLRPPAPVAAAATDGGGAFTFDALPEGRLLFLAEAGESRACHTLEATPAGRRLELTLALSPGPHALDVRVEHEGGAPWQGLVAVLPLEPSRAPGLALAGRPTDPQGRARFAGLEEGPVWVVAYEPGTARYGTGAIHLPRASELRLTLPAPAPPGVRVRVLSAHDGQPVSGAVIRAHDQQVGTLREWARQSVTGPDGTCALPCDPVQHVGTVSAAGFLPATLAVTSLPEDGLLEVRLTPTASLSGQVLEEPGGAPAAGAVVGASSSASGRWSEATADAEGRFRLLDLPTGEVSVALVGGPWRLVSEQDAPGRRALAVPAGGRTGVVLAARRVPPLTGQVLTPEGRPVAGACVRPHLDWVPLHQGAEPAPRACATDAEGRFTLDGPSPGCEVRLVVSAPAWGTTCAGPFPWAGEPLEPILVRLPAPGFVRVRVRAADGAPIASARVWAAVTLDDRHRWLQAAAEGRTDRTGAATLGPLPPGRAHLSGQTADGRRFEGPGVDVEGGSTTDAALHVRASAGLTITGQARFEDGGTFRGVSLTGPGVPTASIDEQGRFELSGLRPGAVTLHFHVEGLEAPFAVRELEAGARDVRLRLPPPPLRGLTLDVRDPDGARVPFVAYTRLGGPDGQGEHGGRVAGLLRLSAFAGTAYVLVSGARGADAQPLNLAPRLVGPLTSDGATHVVRLTPGLVLAGRVLDPAGRPLEGARVTAADRLPVAPGVPGLGDLARGDVSTLSGPDGRFLLPGLDPGPYDLTLLPPPGRWEPPLPGTAEAGRTDLELRLLALHRVVLSVRDPEGRPVPGAVVRCFSGQGRASQQEADARGEASLDVAPQAVERLEALPPPGRRDLDPVERAGPLEAGPALALTLSARRGLAGTVVDESGRPVPGATVLAKGEDDGVAGRTTTDATGRFRLAHVSGRADRIHVERRHGEELEVAAEALGPGPQELILTLRRARTLRVAVDGVPRQSTVSGFLSEDGGARQRIYDDGLDEDGLLVFRGVPPGRRFALWLECDEPLAVAYVRGVEPDAGLVRVTLGPVQRIEGRVLGLPLGERAAVRVAEAGLTAETETRRDGTFTLEGLPMGSFRLEASSGAGPGRRVAAGPSVVGDVVELTLR